MEKLILNHNSTVLCDTLIHDDCKDCIATNCKRGYGNFICPYDNCSKRIGIVKVKAGSVYGCDVTKTTTKNFKNLLSEISATIPELNRTRSEIQKEIEKQTKRRIDRLVHNLRNNNAHMLQTLQLFIPEEKSRMKVRKLYEVVDQQIKTNRHLSIMTFLRLLKHTAEYKAELTVYDLLNYGETTLDIKPYRAYDLVKVVFHEFVSDFQKEGIYVNIGSSYDEIKIDYDSFKVALYYIFENAVKYTLPGSTISFTFCTTSENFILGMRMQSIKINSSEVDKIFDEGYSGEMAKRLHREGSGIGLYRARRLIELNGGKITFEIGESIEKEVNGIQYSTNSLLISFPL